MTVKNQRPAERAVVVALVVALGGAAVSATVLAPITFDELVHESQQIVHGTVVDRRAEWLPGRRGIETLVSVRVMDRLKGAGGEIVTFRVPGGRMGRYRSVFVGAPEFADGDEVILFLTARIPALPTIVGLTQGLFRVQSDSTGARRVMPPLVGGSPGQSTRIVRGDPARISPTIAQFADDVRRRARSSQ
jgi:hypothetical protein